jgi:uncharacterized protein (TIGR02300 family)
LGIKAFDTPNLLWQLAATVYRQTRLKGISMPKEEWGVKRVCPTTGKRFYDMNRTPVISPYTGDEVNIETGKTRMIAADAEDAMTAKAKEADVDDVDVLEDDEDTDIDLGDDVLDDEEDDNVSLDEIADVSTEDTDD